MNLTLNLNNILLIMIIAPLFGSILILLFPISNNSSKIIALNSSLFSFVLSVLLFMNFNKTDPQFQFIGSHIWGTGFQRHEILLGVDGISLFFIILTTLIFPICFLASWNIKNFIKEYFIAFLVMESLLLLLLFAFNCSIIFIIVKILIVYIYSFYILLIYITFKESIKEYINTQENKISSSFTNHNIFIFLVIFLIICLLFNKNYVIFYEGEFISRFFLVNIINFIIIGFTLFTKFNIINYLIYLIFLILFTILNEGIFHVIIFTVFIMYFYNNIKITMLYKKVYENRYFVIFKNFIIYSLLIYYAYKRGIFLFELYFVLEGQIVKAVQTVSLALVGSKLYSDTLGFITHLDVAERKATEEGNARQERADELKAQRKPHTIIIKDSFNLSLFPKKR